MSRVKLANAILDRVLGSLGLARSSKLLEAGNSVNRLSNQLSDKSHRLARAKALGILGVGSSAGASAYNTKILKDFHAGDINKLKNLHTDDINKLKNLHAEEIGNLSKSSIESIGDIQSKYDTVKKVLTATRSKLKDLDDQFIANKAIYESNKQALDSVRAQMARYNNDFTGFSDDTVLEAINQVLKQHK